MKSRFPLLVILRHSSVLNVGHLQSGNDTATSTAARLYFQSRTVLGTDTLADQDAFWGQA
jgi:hypothetical protein